MRAMRQFLSFVFILIAFGLVACGRTIPQPKPPMAVKEFRIIRSYDFTLETADPQPSWHPARPELIVRTGKGFALLNEDANLTKRGTFSSEEGRDYWYPFWVDADHFAVFPSSKITRTRDGTLVFPPMGPCLATYDNGIVSTTNLASKGSRGRPWNGAIITQHADEIFRIDPVTVIEERFAPGFEPEPQDTPDKKGQGILFRDRPSLTPDYWGGEDDLGDTIIRWKPGQTDRIPNSLQGRWTANGGVVLTQLPKGKGEAATWWSKGCYIIHVAGPGKPFELIAPGWGHSPMPHPQAQVLAYIDTDGGLKLVSFDGKDEISLAPKATSMVWSPDGLRLAYVTPGEGGGSRIVVLVFASKDLDVR